MKVVSWNVNSLRVRLPQVLQLIQQSGPDVIALQETKLQNQDFPRDELESAGYRLVFNGQRTYNGVALMSRTEPADIITDIPGLDDPQRRLAGATINDIRFLNVYVPNGQALDSDKYQYKLRWLEAFTDMLAGEIAAHSKLVVMGDFNIAPEDQDVYDPNAWRGQVLVSDAERQALQKIMALGLQDTFRLFPQEDNRYSWWDYRAGAFPRNRGLRIDLMLASPEMAELCQAADIDLESRSHDRPSDHALISADFRV
ncbi:MAG: exodeoxyribonuclease III [Gammaproteobacteria bacterium]